MVWFMIDTKPWAWYHAFVHTFLFGCFLCNSEYVKEYIKSKSLDSKPNGKSFVCYLGVWRFKSYLHPSICTQCYQVFRLIFIFTIFFKMCVSTLFHFFSYWTRHMRAHCTFSILPVPRDFHIVAKNLHDIVIHYTIHAHFFARHEPNVIAKEMFRQLKSVLDFMLIRINVPWICYCSGKYFAKWAPRYCGPFEILKWVGSSAYHLVLPIRLVLILFFISVV